MKTLSDFDFKNKTVLLRTDLNSDVKSGRVIESARIEESAETINELKRSKAKIVVLAHQGRPGGEQFTGLKQHCQFLNQYTKVKFVPDVRGKKARREIRNLRPGQAILLENVRREEDEFKPGKNSLIRFFVPLVDFYVNDAFSVCHREQTSIVSFPKYLKSCAGRLLEREVEASKEIRMRKCLFILGGAKPEEELLLLGKNKVLTCGLFGQLCLIAKGEQLGAQEKYLKKEIKDFDKIVRELKKKLKRSKVETPIDFAVEEGGKRKEVSLRNFPNNFEIFDIGIMTQEKYRTEIRKAGSVFMKGPAGDCGEAEFCNGTLALLEAISENKGFTVVGGGHLSDAVKSSRINKNRFSHVSLSGGALVKFIAGKKLPGLEVL